MICLNVCREPNRKNWWQDEALSATNQRAPNKGKAIRRQQLGRRSSVEDEEEEDQQGWYFMCGEAPIIRGQRAGRGSSLEGARITSYRIHNTAPL